jgi:hypothetical protein
LSSRLARVDALDGIGFTWKVTAAAWDAKYQQLILWRQRNGHTAVPMADALGCWVSKQRQSFKLGKLAQEKVDALNDIDFTWSTIDEGWEQKFQQLVAWKKAHGNIAVPYSEHGWQSLGWWSNSQRQSKRKGKLSAKRQALLDKAGFAWSPSVRRPKLKKRRGCALDHMSIPDLRLDEIKVEDQVISPAAMRSPSLTTASHSPWHELESTSSVSMCISDVRSSLEASNPLVCVNDISHEVLLDIPTSALALHQPADFDTLFFMSSQQDVKDASISSCCFEIFDPDSLLLGDGFLGPLAPLPELPMSLVPLADPPVVPLF